MEMPDGKEYLQRIRKKYDGYIYAPDTDYWRKIIKELSDPKIKLGKP